MEQSTGNTLSPKEVNFQVNGLTLRGKRWGEGSAHRVLALHGWLDNCHSFKPLAEHLHDIDFVAIDAAGQGLSDFRSADAAYNIWQDITEIDVVRKQLGWQQFTLLGHSRGAIHATLYAGTLSEAVTQLVLLDGFIPYPVDEASAPTQLAAGIRDRERFANSQPRFYKERAQAIDSRLSSGFSVMSREAIECLANRSLIASDEGYYWRADRRLRAASEVKFTQGQLAAFVNACPCKITIFAIPKRQKLIAPAIEEWPLTADITILPIDGEHHFHMEREMVAPVAEQINRLICQQG